MEGMYILSKNVSVIECLRLCCDKGPTLCRYVWLFHDRCIGLPCVTNMTACAPQTVDGLPSTMFAIKYDIEKGNRTTPGKLYGLV